ncbi:MAG: 3'-5' exonuclease domain-containing protein 2 [Lachnospiraceae bacterium]|nr:3'-5' exonuclease domain-containing protein 2 [Lachnospiraceae bacterium]
MSYPGAITLVDSAAVAHKALRILAKEDAVGFDTETRPSFKKGRVHNAALMQISTDERCFLFRLNKIGICAELKAFLENQEILKIGLSVHDDFNVLRRTTPIEPQGFIDLQHLVKNYDIADTSLQKIYAIVFGERISKSQRLTNWESETLTEPQQAYAALDAWACLKLYRYFKSGSFNPLASPYRHIPEPVLIKENK